MYTPHEQARCLELSPTVAKDEHAYLPALSLSATSKCDFRGALFCLCTAQGANHYAPYSVHTSQALFESQSQAKETSIPRCHCYDGKRFLVIEIPSKPSAIMDFGHTCKRLTRVAHLRYSGSGTIAVYRASTSENKSRRIRRMEKSTKPRGVYNSALAHSIPLDGGNHRDWVLIIICI